MTLVRTSQIGGPTPLVHCLCVVQPIPQQPHHLEQHWPLLLRCPSPSHAQHAVCPQCPQLRALVWAGLSFPGIWRVRHPFRAAVSPPPQRSGALQQCHPSLQLWDRRRHRDQQPDYPWHPHLRRFCWGWNTRSSSPAILSSSSSLSHSLAEWPLISFRKSQTLASQRFDSLLTTPGWLSPGIPPTIASSKVKVNNKAEECFFKFGCFSHLKNGPNLAIRGSDPVLNTREDEGNRELLFLLGFHLLPVEAIVLNYES